MTKQNRKPVLGLVGGIGSGKSQVADALARRGAYVIEADKLGHEALLQEDIKAKLIHRWTKDICTPDGEIDRKKVGALVFANPEERRELENIVFPYIGRRIEEELARGQKDEKTHLIVLDAAIMLETGWANRCDRIVYVHAPRRVRLKRLLAKRGWQEKEVEQRTKAQMALTDKVSKADYVVDNSTDLVHLSQQIDKLLQRLEQPN